MKKTILALGLLCAALVHADDFSGHTFFTVRPQGILVSPEKEVFFRNDRMLKREYGVEGAVQVFVFGGQSNNCCNINKYFMPQNYTSLNAQEYKSPTFTQDGLFTKELEARNFNIKTLSTTETFKSNIFFRPQQSTAGIGFTWLQNLWHDYNDVPRIWMEFNMPVQYVQNKMNLHETVINDGGGVNADTGLDGAPHVANMTEAFQQSTWVYGKVNDCRDMHEWGVSEIEFTLGYNAVACNTCDFNGYAGFVAPTGTKIDQKNAAYIFSPVVGNNHHWGLLFGAHSGFTLLEHKEHLLRMEFDFEGQYLFKNTQWRSFDLVQQGQWSRYLEVYRTMQNATTASTDPVPLNMDAGMSGINVFTTSCQVHPKFSVNTNTGFTYNWKGLQAEAGYNFYARQAEQITKCANSWYTDVAVKDVTGDGLTNIARTIKNNFTPSNVSLADYETISVLTVADLNLNSAAHPTMIAHTAYVAIGWNWDEVRFPTFVGVGGSYEFTAVDTALDRWLVFGKIGFSF